MKSWNSESGFKARLTYLRGVIRLEGQGFDQVEAGVGIGDIPENTILMLVHRHVIVPDSSAPVVLWVKKDPGEFLVLELAGKRLDSYHDEFGAVHLVGDDFFCPIYIFQQSVNDLIRDVGPFHKADAEIFIADAPNFDVGPVVEQEDEVHLLHRRTDSIQVPIRADVMNVGAIGEK